MLDAYHCPYYLEQKYLNFLFSFSLRQPLSLLLSSRRRQLLPLPTFLLAPAPSAPPSSAFQRHPAGGAPPLRQRTTPPIGHNIQREQGGWAMGEPVKGTVTSLSSIYSPEDAQKASVRVQEQISEYQKQVQQLQGFLNDNTNLVNLVPFGKAAFFPGKLIHTNEFLVLLGEGYYADRTSKQTIEILKRRGKDLESQIENLNAVIKDLKYEASFFDETATEAAEGVVEIREDYVDEVSDEEEKDTPTPGEDDFARILSRIDELEKEEMESEMAEEAEDEDKPDLSHLLSHTHIEPEVIHSEPKESSALPVSKNSDLDLSSNIKAPTSSASNNTLPRAVEQKKLESLPNTPVSKNEAFTGSIVEHTHNTEKSQTGQPPAPASKPVSRFKMRKK
uniref:Uncharacterized protein n=1 Tax=Lactuca sativa TaxID=4236 RepID=A0A9R1VQL1_LACSA|nr:hypothetical protein LSAT_V11C400168750 [Lactuca sativa]